MTINFAKPSYTIAAGSTISGISPQAQKIKVANGRIWLTIAGVHEDFWLHAGESLTVPANRLIVIEADQQASRIETKTAASSQLSAYGNQVASNVLQKLTQKLSQAFA